MSEKGRWGGYIESVRTLKEVGNMEKKKVFLQVEPTTEEDLTGPTVCVMLRTRTKEGIVNLREEYCHWTEANRVWGELEDWAKDQGWEVEKLPWGRP